MPIIKGKYKTVVQRIAAAFIDGVVFLPVSFLFNKLTSTEDALTFVFWSTLSACIWLAYTVYMHGRYGQTLGKMASDVKVFSLDEQSLIGYKRSFLREIISTALVVFGLVYVLVAAPHNNAEEVYDEALFYPSLISSIIEITTTLFSPKRRSVHDFIAGSVVLNVTKYKKWDLEYEEN